MPSSYELLKKAPQKRKRAGVFLLCEKCHQEFYVMPSRLRQAEKNGTAVRYCSMACYNHKGENGSFFGKSHTAEAIERMKAHPNRPKFKADETNPNVSRFGKDFKHQASRRLRGKLLVERGSRCERCGYDEVPGVLEVHHKDRNRQRNDRLNLSLLCPTCHAVEHYLSRDGSYVRLRKEG